jgi:hypothetical protein
MLERRRSVSFDELSPKMKKKFFSPLLFLIHGGWHAMKYLVTRVYVAFLLLSVFSTLKLGPARFMCARSIFFNNSAFLDLKFHILWAVFCSPILKMEKLSGLSSQLISSPHQSIFRLFYSYLWGK